ncbi:hypothetical protein [Halalkalibacter hemicellulosilyticus]|uniref:Uncharacterized protein n=1 Tax=Halalkalibacter hemicellulosilyticusJCM 9152 TaxID=1236971 RepID=W4QH98_9BACI|nr:hypothetical protein [Halalkalibacter hemicellulosilyticus]GAE30724.1 hypothetical protein JCM9152_2140 [Halalkalibacter hemicellulosilyticusJCM 9152]
MVEMMIIVLFSCSFLLFILSFIKKDRTVELEQQIEELSIRHMQELYKLKKRVDELESQTRLNEQQSAFVQKAKSSSQQQLLREVIGLFNQDLELESIAEETGLTVIEVERLLRPYITELQEKEEL